MSYFLGEQVRMRRIVAPSARFVNWLLSLVAGIPGVIYPL
jgi:ABC-type phosphate transport system permease subunit